MPCFGCCNEDKLLASIPLVYLCYDSEFAARISIGSWVPKRSQTLYDINSVVYEACQSCLPLQCHHTRSHEGHPFNEMADSAATAASNSSLHMPLVQFNFDLGEDVHALKWISRVSPIR